MLRALRSDLELVEMRGNVDTRLRKLADGEADALILARAGLVRLGLEQHVTTVLDTRRFVPAVGQGVIGLTCRSGDRETRRLLRAVTDLEAWDEAMAERALLRGLRGGCNVPVGGHARVVEGTLALRARVSSVDGSETLDGEITGSRDAAQELGRLLADDLLRRGARRLIDLARA
jgi:hydroxymethylbilane synthase